MILALDVGNSQIHGGVYQEDVLKVQFRKNTKTGNSSDELGLFLKSVIRENDIDPALVRHIAICSVVPDVIHSLKGACQKYFGITPFILAAGARTGLNVKYRNPLEVGTDRIANAIAGVHLYPGQNLIIADFGTATTLDIVTAEKNYLGGLILPGLKISMEALESKTARLPSVEIVRPGSVIGRSTIESIQSGLYFQNLYALRGLCAHIRDETFEGKNTLVIGTGGFSRMFESEGVFNALVPELVLTGLNLALRLNL